MPEGAGAHGKTDALREAAEWFAVLSAETIRPDERLAWQRWLDASADNARAWERVEAMRRQFTQLASHVDRQVASTTLMRSLGRRRRALKLLGGTGLALGLGGAMEWMREGDAGGSSWAGDFRTDVGERRQWTLADGSTAWLNTGSAVRLRFDDVARTLHLLRGELLVIAADDVRRPRRPFQVATGEGGIACTAGARFGVYRDGGRCQVTVFDGAVEVRPAAAGDVLALASRQQAVFDRDGVVAAGPAQALREAWTTGFLVADDMRLEDVVRELARYVRGHLGCAPEVAGLRVVGAFPLADPERTYRALEAALPIRVERRWGWWTELSAR